MQSPASSEDELFTARALAVILLLTFAAALRYSALGTTLFEDEVWVAELLRRGDLSPRSYATPPLFYAVGRVWTNLRGFADPVLREPSALFGVLLAAVPFLAPRPFRTRLLWAAFLAFSSPLLFYSTRLKQYTLETFAATVLLVLFLRAHNDGSRRRWIVFLLVAAASVMVLHTAIFTAAAAGTAVLLSRERRTPLLLAGFLVVGLLGAVAYFGYMAPSAESTRVHGDMDAWFAETGRWVDSSHSLVRNTAHWTGQAFNLVPFWWLVLAPLVALWIFRRRDIAVITLALVPPVAVAAASALHVYPYGEVRLMMFCFPALFLVAAEAITDAFSRLEPSAIVLSAFIAAGVGGEPYNGTYMQVQDLRIGYRSLIDHARKGWDVYADPSHAAPLLYYAPDLAHRIHSVRVERPDRPGWYVQKTGRFAVSLTDVGFIHGNVVIARFGAAPEVPMSPEQGPDGRRGHPGRDAPSPTLNSQ